MELAAIDLTILPSVRFTDRQLLPTSSGVYFVLTDTRDVLYIGKAESLRARWKGTAHHRYPQLRDMSDIHIAWYQVPLTSWTPKNALVLLNLVQS